MTKNKKKHYRILFLCNINLAKNDGQTVHVIELLESFKKNGHKIKILVPKRGFYHDKILEIKYVPVINIPLFGFIINKIIFSFYLFFYRISFNPDFIYIRFEETFLEAIIISKILNLPIFIEINGLPFEENKLSRLSICRLFFIRLTFFVYLRLADRIIVVTEGIKREIVQRYKVSFSKIEVIPNGVNISLFQPLSSLECKKNIGLEENYLYVCFIGNLVWWQGLNYLIESAPLVLKKVPNVKFLIVGDGPLKEDLLELVKENGLIKSFIFVNKRPHREIPKYINASDICVCYKIPMKSGFSPLKLYEYMAVGKPVVVSDTGGFEMIKKNNTGLLVEPKNSEKLAKALIKLLKNKELREKMGENGRRLVIKKYSWDIVTKKIINVFETLCKEKRK